MGFPIAAFFQDFNSPGQIHQRIINQKANESLPLKPRQHYGETILRPPGRRRFLAGPAGPGFGLCMMCRFELQSYTQIEALATGQGEDKIRDFPRGVLLDDSAA